MNNLINFITSELIDKISKEAIVFIISLMPILELRGGLIAASLLNVEYFRALIISIIGNILPIPFILLFIEKILIWLDSFKPTKKISNMLKNKVKKNKTNIEKYGYVGLILFVGIPLPGTGAWTGALIAALMQLDFKKSLICIFIGILLASIIMSILAYGLLVRVI